jgi:hypothetical protein
MEKEFEIKIDGFLYAVDKPCFNMKWYIDDTNVLRENIIKEADYWNSRKDYHQIIASNNPSLTDILQLPPVEQDVDQLSLESTNSEEEKSIKTWNTNQFIDYSLPIHCKNIEDGEILFKRIYLNRSSDYRRGFKNGYKAAQPKQFTAEDMKNAYNAGKKNKYECTANGKDRLCYCKNEGQCTERRYISSEEYLQSLQPVPKGVCLLMENDVPLQEGDYVKVVKWIYE